MSHVKIFRHTLLAAVVICAACNGDESEARVVPGFFEGGVLVGDSGLPPVFVPPPTFAPPPDAGVVMMPQFPTGMDAGNPFFRPDGGVRDTGLPVSTIDTGAAPPPSDDPSVSNPCGVGPEPLAADIAISEVSVYQVTKVPVYKGGVWVTTRNAALVQGKKALVRAFVEPAATFTPRALRGVLTLDNDGKKAIYQSDRMIARASTDDAADSTFTFQVDASAITASTQLSVSVLESVCAAPAANPGARVPAAGGQAINADAIGKMKVVVVPISIGGRVPDTSEAQLQKFHDELLAYYPVPEVEVTAHAPVTFTGTVQASGGGWSEVLMLVGRTRQQDVPATNVYYFGLMTPAATFREYCRSGCVAGLAPQTTIVSRSNQIGLGVGYVDPTTASTMAHELGHAHGLPHAPCARGGSIDGVDPRFPYTGGKIGVWGWDSRINKLMSPATYTDLMGYCDPVWISDYNYAKIATRAKAVNTSAFIIAGEKLTSWQGILLRADGSAGWSGMTSDEIPGEPSAARALDAQGRVLSQIEVVRVSLSEGGDSILYVPEPKSGWAAIDLGDRVLKLADLAAAPY
jgi:hypothetical protein